MNDSDFSPIDFPREWTRWTDFNPSALQANLQCLKKFHPDLDSLLETFDINSDYYLRQNDVGIVECAHRIKDRQDFLFSSSHLQSQWPSVQASLKSFSPNSHETVIVHLGFDLGNSLDRILDRLRQGDRKAIVFVEPEPIWFILSLAVRSWEILLSSNRCFFAIGERWLDQFQAIFEGNPFFAIDRPDLFFSATSRFTHRLPLFAPVKTKISEWMQDGRKKHEKAISKIIQYYQTKTQNRIQRMMALFLDERDGKAIPYIQQRFLEECQRLGIEIVYHRPGFRSDVGYLQTLMREKPDLLLFINKSVSEFTNRQILDRIRIPRMTWCLDDPNCFIREPFGENDFVFTWDRSYLANLQRLGARSVDFFPYVADMDGLQASPQKRFYSPVSFVGQVKVFTPDEWGMDERTARLVERVGNILAQNPRAEYSKQILECQGEFDLTVIRHEGDPIPQPIRYAIYIIANAQRRIAFLESARPFGLKIYGNEDWRVLLKEHPLRDCYVGPADPQREVPSIFVSSTINLNIHSLQALSSLNQRDFNCPLMGGFLLTDWVEGAEEFFHPDREMVFYSNERDLQEKIHFYLTHEVERNDLVARGRDRVLRDHTYSARVPRVLETLETRIRERFQ